jgi:Cytochrome C'
MRIHAVSWSVCGVLALGLCLLAVRSSFSYDDDDKKAKLKELAEARAAIIELSQGKGNPKEIAKKHELGYIMAGFKLRAKNGIGVGPAAVAGNPKQDGIEAKIISLTTGKRMSRDELKAQTQDLIKLLEIAKAIGDVATAENYPEEAKKDPKKWKAFNDDMIKSLKEAKEVVKSGDPMKVKAVFNKLDGACQACHAEFK